MSRLITAHLPCKDCGSSDALAQYEDNTHCFSCSTTRWTEKRKSLFSNKEEIINQQEFGLPADFTSELPGHAKAWFYKYRIYDPERYSFGWSQHLNRVILPVWDEKDFVNIKLQAFQARDLTGNAKEKYLTFKNPEYKEKPRFFFPEYSSEFAIVVEDIISAVRVGRIAGPSVALLGTSIDDELRLYLACCKKVIIWLDGDDPGLEAAQTIYNKLYLHTQVKIISTPKDPKEYSDEEIEQILGTKNDKRHNSSTGNEASK